MNTMVSIDDFKKIEMKIGQIKTVERVPDTDKLLRLTVDFGPKPVVEKTEEEAGQSVSEEVVEETETKEAEERDIRQVVSGIAGFFEDPQTLVDVKCPFVTNLEPRTIRGLESQAMILAVVDGVGGFSILQATLADIPVGTKLS
jgi:methionyl-tRNA synthetase